MSSKGIGRGLGRRQFAVERLEPRAMLAGNVTATVTGGSLVVKGDKLDNQVAIVQLDSDSYAVVGLPGTNIVGGSASAGGTFKVLHGVTGNIDVDLKEGNDVLGIGNDLESLLDKASSLGFPISSSIYSFASSVSSSLSLSSGNLVVPKNLLIKTGAGNDAVGIVADVTFNAIIELGDGDNGIIIDPTYIGDDLIINGGKGLDFVNLQDTYVKDVLSVNLKEGAKNSIRIEDTCDEGPSYIGGSAVIRAGKGNDGVSIYDTTIVKNLDIGLGDGYNNVNVEDTCDCEEAPMLVNGSAIVNTGKHEDSVNFFNTHIGLDLIVNTNGGNDSVNFIGGLLDCCEYEEVDAQVSEEIEPSASVGLSAIINTGANGDYVTVGTQNLFSGLEASESYGIAGPVTIGLNLIINTGAGSDRVAVEGGGIAYAPITSGSESYENHSVLIGLNLSIDTSGGKANDDYDLVAVCDTHVGDDLIVVTGESSDRVEIGCDEYASPAEEAELASVPEFCPEDSDVYVGDDLTVNLGNGDDNGYSDTLNAVADDLAGLLLRNTYIEDTAVIDLGEGHDTANVDTCYIGNDAVVNLGGGNDKLSVKRVYVGDDAVINAGAGNDCINIRCSEVVDVLDVNMGAGSNDDLRIRDSRARLAVLRADKTNDNDVLFEDGNDIDTFDIFGFELINP